MHPQDKPLRLGPGASLQIETLEGRGTQGLANQVFHIEKAAGFRRQESFRLRFLSALEPICCLFFDNFDKGPSKSFSFRLPQLKMYAVLGSFVLNVTWYCVFNMTMPRLF